MTREERAEKIKAFYDPDWEILDLDGLLDQIEIWLEEAHDRGFRDAVGY